MLHQKLNAVALLLSWGLLSGSAVALEASKCRIRLEPGTVLAQVPGDFLGFGYETSAVAQPGFFSGGNARMIRLYRNLGPHGLIRIGGNISDHTRYEPDGAAVVRSERGVTVINRASLQGLGDFARATGWEVMWGLNLKTETPEQAVEEAEAVAAALGPRLQSFEIGNEIDLMPRYARDYEAYHADYTRYKAAIRARLPQAAFSGPDSAGNWSFVQKFAAQESADIKLVTHHYYRGGASEPRSTLPLLLARDGRFDERLTKLQSLCDERRLTYRINEVNSFFGGGKAGVSDTFGSALWCLDFMFDVAAHRGGGINMETDINQLAFISHYSPIVHDAQGLCTARPEYYAMLAFSIAGRGALIKTVLDAGDANLTAYATRDTSGAIRLTVINKALARDASVQLVLPPGFTRAGAYRLQAPSADAKAGVTLAGQAVGDDGAWTAGKPEPLAIDGGAARLSLPHASAAIIHLLP